MAFIDKIEKIVLTATEDYSVGIDTYSRNVSGKYFTGRKDKKIVIKGEQYEVPKCDWIMFKNSKMFGAYLIRKVGNKKANNSSLRLLTSGIVQFFTSFSASITFCFISSAITLGTSKYKHCSAFIHSCSFVILI